MALSGLVFAGVFVAFFVLRAIAATVVFYWLLPQGDRCPCCDTPTLRVQSPWWNRLVPWFRTSWCYACGWEGMLRDGELTPLDAPPRSSGTSAPSPAPRDSGRSTRREQA
jgi:hypothetical protein